jgi:hypothetical protein
MGVMKTKKSYSLRTLLKGMRDDSVANGTIEAWFDNWASIGTFAMHGENYAIKQFKRLAREHNWTMSTQVGMASADAVMREVAAYVA